MRTFTDFVEETDLRFSELKVTEGHPWASKKVLELGLPKDILLCMLRREDGTELVPNGHTFINEGDLILFCSKEAKGVNKCVVREQVISKRSKYVGRELREYPVEKAQVLLIRRGGETIIPHGSTILQADDVLFINNSVKK